MPQEFRRSGSRCRVTTRGACGHAPRVLLGRTVVATLRPIQEAPDLLGPVTSVAAQRADRRQLSRSRPARDRLRVHAEQGRHLRRRQQRILLLRPHRALTRFAAIISIIPASRLAPRPQPGASSEDDSDLFRPREGRVFSGYFWAHTSRTGWNRRNRDSRFSRSRTASVVVPKAPRRGGPRGATRSRSSSQGSQPMTHGAPTASAVTSGGTENAT